MSESDIITSYYISFKRECCLTPRKNGTELEVLQHYTPQNLQFRCYLPFRKAYKLCLCYLLPWLITLPRPLTSRVTCGLP